MARPGLEPGTPRFSVVRSRLSNVAEIPANPLDPNGLARLETSRKFRSFLADSGDEKRLVSHSGASPDVAMLIETRTLDGDIQELIYRPTLHTWARRREADAANSRLRRHAASRPAAGRPRRTGPPRRVGKIAVPHTILNQPGPLTDGEWKVMRWNGRRRTHVSDRSCAARFGGTTRSSARSCDRPIDIRDKRGTLRAPCTKSSGTATTLQ